MENRKNSLTTMSKSLAVKTSSLIGKAANGTAGIVGKAAVGTAGMVTTVGNATVAGLDKVGLGGVTKLAGGGTKAGVSAGKLALIRGASTMKMFNSRAVGGAKPHPKLHCIYHEVESINYGESDTLHNEQKMMEHFQKQNSLKELKETCMKPRLNRGAYIWFLYLMIGTMVSVTVSLILTFTGFIEKTRDKYTQKYILEKGLGYGWLLWTGSSLLCTTLACLCVLIRPAAAASGIPGLLSLLNGTSPQVCLCPSARASFFPRLTILTRACLDRVVKTFLDSRLDSMICARQLRKQLACASQFQVAFLWVRKAQSSTFVQWLPSILPKVSRGLR